MKFSRKSSDATARVEPRLAAAGGVSYSRRDDRDPYEILDELMTVVDAPSPQWPARDTCAIGDDVQL